MIEVLDYIFEKDKKLINKFPRWKILSFLDKHKDRFICIYENGKIKGFSIYLKLTDETLYKVLCRDFQFKDFKSIDNALREDGENIHFVRLISDRISIIRKGIKRVIEKEKPETISWFNKDIDKLFFYDLRRGGING